MPDSRNSRPDFEDERPEIPDGAPVAHYRILRRIGRGGMGEVYLAHDTRLDRQVALKFPRRGIQQDPEARARLIEEARAASRLNHRNVVSVYAIEEHEGRCFIAMEYVEGRTLAEVLADGPAPLDGFRPLAIQILEGLAAAHASGVVHRDIKPTNVILNAQGDVKIMDFGIAARAGEARSGGTGSTTGTLAYMAPEQITGNPGDERSDVFAAAVLLYELLAAQRPFHGSYEAALAYAIASDEPPSLMTHRPDVKTELEAVLARALSKSPDDRFQDGTDFAQAMREALRQDAVPIIANRWRWMAGALAAVTLIFLGWFLRHGSVPVPGTSPEPVTMLAVLPFENLGPPDDEYFAEGVADAVATRLARVQGLGVIARGATNRYAGSDLPAEQIGSELGVQYLLRSTIAWEKSGSRGRIRVAPKLIGVADGRYVWADEYVRELEDLFSLQSEIAQRVVDALGDVLGQGSSERETSGPTESIEAYDLYLRGNAYFNRSWDEDDIRIAQRMYERASARDSNFALAWAMLSRVHASMYWEYYDRSEMRREASHQAALRAVELGPELPESHLALGYFYYHCHLDYQRALSEFALALSRQPSNSDLLNAIGAVQRRMGDLPAAAESFKRSLLLDPRSNLKAFDVALTCGLMRDFAQARTYLAQAADISPDWTMPHVYSAWLYILESGDVKSARQVLEQAAPLCNLRQSKYYWWLVRILYDDYGAQLGHRPEDVDRISYLLYEGRLHRLLGDAEKQKAYYDSARVALEREVLAQPEAARYWSWFALAQAGTGRPGEAVVSGERAMELLPASKDAFDALFLSVEFAETLMMAGRYDAAIDQLERLLAMPGFVSRPYLRLDPLWNPLRDQPRFERLLADSAVS